MKKIFLYPLFFLVVAFACKKDNPARPSILHLSGIVTDKQTAILLDSVKIYLEKSYYGPIIIATFYSGTDGKFNFQFSPENGFNSYQMSFEKKGYCYAGCSDVLIDLDKEYQTFNVQLVK